MQDKEPIDKILKKRISPEVNIDELNSKILGLARATPQCEFSSILVHTKIKILALAACFVLGLFSSINTPETISSDLIEYIYIEKGIS